ncbi:MAG: tRNA pseudouridine(55) synthase TruB [Desulfovibrio sp.]|nr:tRNA pseudouridine(55) synthase TruB [Desulfovibrio sp.]
MQQPQLPQLHGLLVVNKPQGISSNHCLMQIKRLGQKKIGHAGTLDPMAEGVLLVLLGQATKLSSYLLEGGGKIYAGTLLLGQETDTWDAEGTVVAQHDWRRVDSESICSAISDWVNQNEQQVPPYSAAKKNGQPLYRLARKGERVERTKSMTIRQAEVLTLDLPYVSFRVHCSSGTYIRSLAHSLGTRLGCGATLTALTREYSHPFGLESAHSLDAFTTNPTTLVQALVPMHCALPDWPRLAVPDSLVDWIKNGHSVPVSALGGDNTHSRAFLMHNDCELALARVEDTDNGGEWKIIRGLWGSV